MIDFRFNYLQIAVILFHTAELKRSSSIRAELNCDRSRLPRSCRWTLPRGGMPCWLTVVKPGWESADVRPWGEPGDAWLTERHISVLSLRKTIHSWKCSSWDTVLQADNFCNWCRLCILMISLEEKTCCQCCTITELAERSSVLSVVFGLVWQLLCLWRSWRFKTALSKHWKIDLMAWESGLEVILFDACELQR